MIFVCLGTKRFPFNRLLEEIDRLVEERKIRERVFAQIGHSTYIPKHYEYKRFMEPAVYDSYVEKSEIIITHGGTGAIIKALKAGKQTIAVPRLHKLGEHSDDHQLQVVSLFEKEGYISRVDKMLELESTIKYLKLNPIQKMFTGDGNILKIIDEFITKP